eukprot:4905334-Lingulodinium_polyedra.AAC.1
MDNMEARQDVADDSARRQNPAIMARSTDRSVMRSGRRRGRSRDRATAAMRAGTPGNTRHGDVARRLRP